MSLLDVESADWRFGNLWTKPDDDLENKLKYNTLKKIQDNGKAIYVFSPSLLIR